MKPYDTPAETAFAARVYAQFPYDSRELATAIIEECRTISANAVFYVLDEICRPPWEGMVSQQRQRELVEEWAAGFEHPLKARVLQCAEALVSDRHLAPSEAVAAMEEIALFDGQRAALSIAYCSGDGTSKQGDDALTSAERRVRASWDERGV